MSGIQAVSEADWRPMHALVLVGIATVVSFVPFFRVWPLMWLVPLAGYAALVATLPPLRATFRPWRFGRICVATAHCHIHHRARLSAPRFLASHCLEFPMQTPSAASFTSRRFATRSRSVFCSRFSTRRSRRSFFTAYCSMLSNRGGVFGRQPSPQPCSSDTATCTATHPGR